MSSNRTVVVVGGSGMLGGYVAAYLRTRGHRVFLPPTFDAASVSEAELADMLPAGSAAAINCIGVIKQRLARGSDGGASREEMMRVNGVFPHTLASACEAKGVPLIHSSTDCVFNGTKGNYTERDRPDATDLYGTSKARGEPAAACVVRTSIIGSERKQKLSLLEWVKTRRDGDCDGFTNHRWNGVTCLQLATLFAGLIEEDAYWRGVRHYFSPRDVTKCELIQLISDAYGLGVRVRAVQAPETVDRTLRSVYPAPVVPDIAEQLREQAAFDKQQS